MCSVKWVGYDFILESLVCVLHISSARGLIEIVPIHTFEITSCDCLLNNTSRVPFIVIVHSVVLFVIIVGHIAVRSASYQSPSISNPTSVQTKVGVLNFYSIWTEVYL